MIMHRPVGFLKTSLLGIYFMVHNKQKLEKKDRKSNTTYKQYILRVRRFDAKQNCLWNKMFSISSPNITVKKYFLNQKRSHR